MKKIIGLLGFIVLVFTLTVTSPSTSSAALTPVIPVNTNVSEVDVEITNTKYVNRHQVVYYNLELPPFYYNYNVAGWKGTLTRVSYIFYENMGLTYAYYSGTVTCTNAPCGLTIDENFTK